MQRDFSAIFALHIARSMQLPFVFVLLTGHSNGCGRSPIGCFRCDFVQSIVFCVGFRYLSDVGLCRSLLFILLKAGGVACTNAGARTYYGTDTNANRHNRKFNRQRHYIASIYSFVVVLLKHTLPMMMDLLLPLHLILSSQSRSIVACSLPHTNRRFERLSLPGLLFSTSPRFRDEMAQSSFIWLGSMGIWNVSLPF